MSWVLQASALDDIFAADTDRKAPVLEAAYAQCEVITKIFAKTFYLGTRLMTEDQKKAGNLSYFILLLLFLRDLLVTSKTFLF